VIRDGHAPTGGRPAKSNVPLDAPRSAGLPTPSVGDIEHVSDVFCWINDIEPRQRPSRACRGPSLARRAAHPVAAPPVTLNLRELSARLHAVEGQRMFHAWRTSPSSLLLRSKWASRYYLKAGFGGVFLPGSVLCPALEDTPPFRLPIAAVGRSLRRRQRPTVRDGTGRANPPPSFAPPRI